jgi:hypothetical protein
MTTQSGQFVKSLSDFPLTEFGQKLQRKQDVTTTVNMIYRERIIQNYIDGYNQFNINKMVVDFDENITFENVQNGQINLSLAGLKAFRQQAELAKSYFTTRQQKIKSFKHLDNETEIEIDYKAVFAIDFPNGLKSGQELNLTGKSVFEFAGNKIIKLTDIS